MRNLPSVAEKKSGRSARHAYGQLDPQKIRIVHAYGEQLEAFYAQADVFGLFWEPYPYLNITMPVKVFESMTHGLPIITTAGTVAAEFIEQENIGWIIRNKTEFKNLIDTLIRDKALIKKFSDRVISVSRHHTWQKRAASVASVMVEE